MAAYDFQSNNLDSSGNNNNAELEGSPEFAPGLDLDGTNQYAMAPAGVMAGVTNFTMASWVWWNGGPEWQRIFDFGNNTNQYMFLTPNSGSGTLRFAVTTNGNGAEQRVETLELPAGQWIYVAVTLNGSTASLYTNGVLAATGPDTIPPASFNPALNNFGASQFPANPCFSGLLESVYIYNYPLTASQVLSLAVPPGFRQPVWATAGNGRVSVAWETSVGATSYTVERSTTDGGPYTPIASGLTTTTYTDTTVANGTTYYYVVQQVNSAGQSPNSAQVVATPSSSLVNLSDYWRFDEGFGMTAYDSVGTNNGTLGPGCSWTTGVINGAISLNGTTGAYVSYPSGLVSQLTNFTVSAWVNLGASNAWQRIFDFGSGTNTYMFLTPEAAVGGPLRFSITTNGSGAEQQINAPRRAVGWRVASRRGRRVPGGVGVLYQDGTAVGTNGSMTLNPAALGRTDGQHDWSIPIFSQSKFDGKCG